MKKLNFLHYLCVLSCCFLCAKNASAKLFDISEFNLDNGLKVIVIPNHKAPIVKHMVWYKVGSVDEPLGKSGKAHLLEHLMFRGTKSVKDSEFNKIIEENGGDSNAFTSLDFTAYHQTVDVSRLELAMFLEADRMKNLNITKESLEKERAIVFQERKQTVDNNPFSYFAEMLRGTLFYSHPYGRPVIGTDEEIKSFSLEDVNGFYKSFYAPNNAILVISGDIDKDVAKTLAEKYYGGIKSKKIENRIEMPIIDKPFSSKIEIALPNINSPRISKSYITHSYNTDKRKMYALMVLSKCLGEGENSKLYKDLVSDKKMALSVSTSYNGLARSYGLFSISMVPELNLNINSALQQLELIIKKSVDGIADKDVDIAKKKMLAGLVYAKDNPKDAGYIVGMMASIGMSVDDIENYDQGIKDVSFEDVRDVAKELFIDSQNITGILLPAKAGQDE